MEGRIIVIFLQGGGFKRTFMENVFPENPFKWAVTASPGASAQ